jgi:hypothetical protein
MIAHDARMHLHHKTVLRRQACEPVKHVPTVCRALGGGDRPLASGSVDTLGVLLG